MSKPRIVSLLPALTEIVDALGWTAYLVGRSHECDHPPEVAGLPALTQAKFAPGGDGLEVHQQVMDIVQHGLSVYRVDADQLAALQPDFILTQTHCEVCAVSEDDVRAAVDQMTTSRPQIVAVAPEKLDEVWQSIRHIAEAFQLPERGYAVVEDLQSKMDHIARRAQSRDQQPSVATIEWMSPLMAGGNWMPELINMAGGVNLFGKAGAHSPWLEWEVLQKADPEVIVIMPCGYPIEQTKRELSHLIEREGWEQLSAVRSGRVYIADGNAYFNRPGPRLVESLEILAEMIHPDAFHFGHEGRAWAGLKSLISS